MNLQMNNVIDFFELKLKIKSLVDGATTHITRKNSDCGAGIYMLFVNNFSDEQIIPFYIGQTTNFQRRYRNHLKDIEKLLEYGFAQYHNAFFWGAVGKKPPFEGKYRPCKILKYLVDHHCCLDDVQMIVLEKCGPENLHEREQYYLDLYLPAFFGFNQISSITEQWSYKDNPSMASEIINRDRLCFRLYMGYGFTVFNYLHGFSIGRCEELDNKVNLILGNSLWPSPDDLLAAAVSAFKEYQHIYEHGVLSMKESFANQVHAIFEKCHFKSKAREEEIISVLVNHYSTPILDDVNDTIDYLEYYFDRNKKSHECGRLLRELFEANKTNIALISGPVMKAYEMYVNSRIHALKSSKYSLIFPQFPFYHCRQ